MSIKETFKIMLEDEGWYDGLCVLAGAVDIVLFAALMYVLVR